MSEIFPTYNMSYDEVLRGFYIEAEGLSYIYHSDMYAKLIKRYENYETYLENNKNDREIKKYIKQNKKNGSVIWASDQSPILLEVLCSAHLAAICELFNTCYLNENILDTPNLNHTIEQQLFPEKNNKRILTQYSNALDQLDAIRTIQILRSLTLVTSKTENLRQLSIGAGAATKDIVSLHVLPKIIRKKDHTTGQYSLHFSLSVQHPVNIIVSDIDPQRNTFYEQLLDNKTFRNCIGLNIDTYDALAKLPTLDKENNLGGRNLFVALRIDHRMLPDVKKFFKLIYYCMEQTADLVITMGSGFTIDEFQGRVDKLQEIFDFLNLLKLEPVLIKLHDKGDIEKQRSTNKFSLSSITTYQILHCKIKKKILSKIL